MEIHLVGDRRRGQLSVEVKEISRKSSKRGALGIGPRTLRRYLSEWI